jgi:hypothetical protein
MAKALKNIDNAVALNAAVIELQEKILAGREAQTALLERVDDLEKQVAGFEQWDAEKEKYQLASIAADTFAYVRKTDASPPQPTHYVCANCYEQREKRILQRSDAAHVTCPGCKTRMYFDSEEAKAFNRSLSSEPTGWKLV